MNECDDDADSVVGADGATFVGRGHSSDAVVERCRTDDSALGSSAEYDDDDDGVGVVLFECDKQKNHHACETT